MISLIVTDFREIFFVTKDFCGYAETDVMAGLPGAAPAGKVNTLVCV